MFAVVRSISRYDTTTGTSSVLNRRPLKWRALSLVVATCVFGVALHIGYLWVTHQFTAPPQFDGISYDLLARNLAEGRGYKLGSQPSTFRPPGYPLFLASLYSLFGPGLIVARFAQVVLATLAQVLTYFLAVRLGLGHRAAILAALGMGIQPLLIYMTATMYPELLGIVLLLIALLVLAVSPEQMSGRRASGAGAALGFMILVRPATVVLLGLFIAALIIAPFHSSSGVLSWPTLRPALYCVLAAVIVVLPWTARNFLVTKEFVLVSSNGGVNLWGGNNAFATGGLVEPTASTWPGGNPPSGLEGWPNLTEEKSDELFTRTAVAWIKSHPSEFVRLMPRKLMRAWGLNFGNEARRLPLPLWIDALYDSSLLVAAAGFALSLSAWRRWMLVYLVPVETTIVSLAFFGSTRQSALVVPVVVLFVAVASDQAVTKLMTSRVLPYRR